MDVAYKEKKNRNRCSDPMDVAYEDKKLHNDGIFDSLMGYKEWFHYMATFSVDGKPLSFVLGFPKSLPGMGALGWISFDKNQYSLAGNPEKPGSPKFFKLETRGKFAEHEKGYTIEYPKTSGEYRGHIKGVYPEYTIAIQTPELDITVTLRIDEPEKSVYTRKLCPWMSGGWFHSGDITAMLEGVVQGKEFKKGSVKGRGWYERNWAHVPVPLPASWFWFATHIETGEVFNLLIEKFLWKRVHYLDECWLYKKGTFYPFSDYKARSSDVLERAVEKRDYSSIIGEHIYCEGKNGENSFRLTATVTDFRQYEYLDVCSNVKWMNPIIETEGEAHIEGESIDMKGRGVAEQASILYWWC